MVFTGIYAQFHFINLFMYIVEGFYDQLKRNEVGSSF